MFRQKAIAKILGTMIKSCTNSVIRLRGFSPYQAFSSYFHRYDKLDLILSILLSLLMPLCERCLIPGNMEAVTGFDRAARQGVAAARYGLGVLLLPDDPEIHDPGLGVQRLEYAARNRNDCAAYRLGKEHLYPRRNADGAGGGRHHRSGDRQLNVKGQESSKLQHWAGFSCPVLFRPFRTFPRVGQLVGPAEETKINPTKKLHKQEKTVGIKRFRRPHVFR